MTASEVWEGRHTETNNETLQVCRKEHRDETGPAGLSRNDPRFRVEWDVLCLVWGREPGVVVRAMGMPSGKAVAPLDRGRRLPVSTNAVRPPIPPPSLPPSPNHKNPHPP